jgi:hypothetical protein
MRQYRTVPVRRGQHRAPAVGEVDGTSPILGLQATAGNRAVQNLLRSASVVQRDVEPAAIAPPTGSLPEIRTDLRYRALERNRLRDQLSDMIVAGTKSYVTYRNVIQRSTAVERQAALNPILLTDLSAALDPQPFARCAELLGRRAPTFDELRRHPTVYEAITAAWTASDIGVKDAVTEAHEEGGWIYMNILDGSISIVRATPTHTDAIALEPAPPPEPNTVLVAMFHTHPSLRNRGPSRHDLVHDARRGIPNLVAANPGSDRAKFQIFLSGPSVRRHLAADKIIPGPGGGTPP